MEVQVDDTGHGNPGFRALAMALEAIPIPTVVKERLVLRDGRDVEVRLHTLIRDITFGELVARMETVEGVQERHREQLMAALAILESFGAIALNSPYPAPQASWRGMRICATSEPAGYLLQSLSRILVAEPRSRSSIRPDSSVRSLRPVIETALRQDELNPHLLLANLLEHGRENAREDPLRTVRVISVLIKGERVKPDSATETVFLHVKKPAWGSYALIGSVQREGEEDEQTARLALEEDLETPADRFDLRPSAVADEESVELSIRRGASTRYAFNLLSVEALSDDLRLRDDLEYAWLTFEEICNQESETGQRIITRADLLQRIDKSRGLDSIPAVVTNPKPFLAKSVLSEAKDVLRELWDVARELGQLIRLVWARLLSHKWWLILLLGVAGFVVVLRPFVNRNIPALGNIADVLGIIAFIYSVVRVVVDRQKRLRNRTR